MSTVDVASSSSYLTAGEAADLLRVTPQTLRRALARGDVHGVRVGRVWRVPVDGLEAAAIPKRAKLADPQPTIHDLRHTHVSGLIADGWDPVEIARRIGDTLQTTLAVYSHEFDARRRGDQRRKALEARYDTGMATTNRSRQQQTGCREAAKRVGLQAVRNRGR